MKISVLIILAAFFYPLLSFTQDRNRAIDVIHIAIDLRFDWEKKQAIGTTTIKFSPLHPVKNISLDAGLLFIHSITLQNGNPLQFEYDGSDRDDALKITLDREYAATEELAIKINYHTTWINNADPNNLWGSFGKGIRFFEPTFTNPSKRKQAWSVGMPQSNRYWFPGYDAPNDFRTTELRATVDKNLVVISNGVLVDSKVNADSSHTFHWKMDIPYANHQTSFVIGEYLDYKQNYEGIELHNFGYPDETAATIASVERLPDMMKFYSTITGMKYPYPSYSQIFVQDFPWGGGHNITASTISENMIDDFGTHKDFLYLWDGVEANDLAAQWFGNFVTPYSWEHSWLNKSFATYLSGLYSEYKNGADEFQLYNRLFNKSTYDLDWRAGIRRPLVTKNYDDPATMTGDNYSTLYGAEVLHMLHKQLGDENWWKTVRHFLQSNAYKSVTTEDFRRAIEESTGQSMNWFFDQWVYKTGHPVFAVTKQYDTAKKRLTIRLRQTQKKDSVTGFFQGNMDIEIDDHIKTVWIEPKAENVFEIESPEQPKIVNVDYGNVWIKELNFEKPFDEVLYQFLHDKDVMARHEAMEKLSALANDETTAKSDKEKIYTAFREIITGKSYWRFRQNALSRLRAMLKPPYSKETTDMLVRLIKMEESSWVRTTALFFLGDTKNKNFASLYISCFDNTSDRVIGAAAFALGKSKSAIAFDALFKLKDKPSWKNQSLMSALNGMKQLGDPRGIAVALDALKDERASPRWTLANNSWDFRVVAAETLVALGKASAGYPVILERFKQSMLEDDINDIFNNTMLIAILAQPGAKEVFDLLKVKFRHDANAMIAVSQYEKQYQESVSGK